MQDREDAAVNFFGLRQVELGEDVVHVRGDRLRAEEQSLE